MISKKIPFYINSITTSQHYFRDHEREYAEPLRTELAHAAGSAVRDRLTRLSFGSRVQP